MHSTAPHYSYEGGRLAFLAATESNKRPDAVFCANDQLAFGVMNACCFERGWRLPEDVSVVGFDDVAEAARPTYSLTTVRQDLTQMAASAVDLLSRRVADPHSPGRVILVSGKIIRRASARLLW